VSNKQAFTDKLQDKIMKNRITTILDNFLMMFSSVNTNKLTYIKFCRRDKKIRRKG
jgi:hypothetical protein